jgi:hypothetical protein
MAFLFTDKALSKIKFLLGALRMSMVISSALEAIACFGLGALGNDMVPGVAPQAPFLVPDFLLVQFFLFGGLRQLLLESTLFIFFPFAPLFLWINQILLRVFNGSVEMCQLLEYALALGFVVQDLLCLYNLFKTSFLGHSVFEL